MKFALTRENFFKNPRLFSGFQGPCLHGLLHRCSCMADELLEAFVLRAARPPPSAPAATSVPWQMLTQLRALWHSTTPESYTLAPSIASGRDGTHFSTSAGLVTRVPAAISLQSLKPESRWLLRVAWTTAWAAQNQLEGGGLCDFTHGPELASRGP